jgi:hypothetical protein
MTVGTSKQNNFGLPTGEFYLNDHFIKQIDTFYTNSLKAKLFIDDLTKGVKSTHAIWTLIFLSNNYPRNIEIKRREFNSRFSL